MVQFWIVLKKDPTEFSEKINVSYQKIREIKDDCNVVLGNRRLELVELEMRKRTVKASSYEVGS